MKSRLEEIKANHEFRKGEGWELTTLTEDIDWLIEQAEKLKKEHAEMKKALTRISEIPMFSDQQTLSVQKAIVIAEECLEDID